MNGIYPPMYRPEDSGIDNYIRNNFTSRTKVSAIKYYRDMTLSLQIKLIKDGISP